MKNISLFLRENQHNPLPLKKGLYINTRIGKCPQFPCHEFEEPVDVHEKALCGWFFNITGTYTLCTEFQAAFRAEFLVTKGALETFVRTKLEVIKSLVFELELGDTTDVLYYVEQLWPVLFDVIEKCEGTGDYLTIWTFRKWCNHKGLTTFHPLYTYWMNQVRTPFDNDYTAMKNTKLIF